MRQITIITPAEVEACYDATTIPLSTMGSMQAVKMATSLDASFDLVLHTSHPGAKQTARIVADHSSGPPYEIPEPQGLSTSIHGKMLIAAQKKYGSVPLAVYFEQGAEDAITAVGYMYYEDITKAIYTAQARYVLIVMDHILATTVSMHMANHVPEKAFTWRVLHPCEGYRLTMRQEDSSRFHVEDINLYRH